MQKQAMEIKSVWQRASSMKDVDLYKIYSEKSILPRKKIQLLDNREARHQQI